MDYQNVDLWVLGGGGANAPRAPPWLRACRNFASLQLFYFFDEIRINKTILSVSRMHNIKILQAYSISLSFPQFVKQDLKKVRGKYIKSLFVEGFVWLFSSQLFAPGFTSADQGKEGLFVVRI